MLDILIPFWRRKEGLSIERDCIFMGLFLGKMVLVAIDLHFKWPEVIIMTSTTTSKTIAVLCDLFSCNGIPRHLVSDNGPQFILEEFSHFMVAIFSFIPLSSC